MDQLFQGLRISRKFDSSEKMNIIYMAVGPTVKLIPYDIEDIVTVPEIDYLDDALHNLGSDLALSWEIPTALARIYVYRGVDYSLFMDIETRDLYVIVEHPDYDSLDISRAVFKISREVWVEGKLFIGKDKSC